jgi:hypothetical protein
MYKYILVITAILFGLNFFIGFMLGYTHGISKSQSQKLECPFPETPDDIKMPDPVCRRLAITTSKAKEFR